MNFRLLTAKEYPRWYHDQLSEAFVPQERKPLPHALVVMKGWAVICFRGWSSRDGLW